MVSWCHLGAFSQGRRRGRRKRDREKERATVLGPECSLYPLTTRTYREQKKTEAWRESVLFMAILILKWYLMSHQHRADLSDGRARSPRARHYCVELAIVVRIHTCVLVEPCCRCQALLPQRSTNDGVELPDGTPRGVRDLYPVWLPCFFSPSLDAPLTYSLLPSPAGPDSRSFPVTHRALSLSPAVRAAPSIPRPRCFAKQTFVSARSTEREPHRRGRR